MTKKLTIVLAVFLMFALLTACMTDVPKKLANLEVRVENLEVDAGISPDAVGIMAPRAIDRDPHNHGFNADEESWVLNGHDITLYSNNKVTEKIRLEGATGTITTVNIAVSGILTATTVVSSSNGFASTNGLDVVGNITMTDGAVINTKGAVSVTDQLYVTSQINGMNGVAVTGNVTVTGAGSFSSQLTASNGVAATGNITVGTDLDVAGNIFSTSGSVRVNDSAIITGNLTVIGLVADAGTLFRINDATVITGATTFIGDVDAQGQIADSANSLRLNDNTLITGTLNTSGVATFNSTVRADSLLTAANSLAVTRAVTVTGNLSVTTLTDLGGAVNFAKKGAQTLTGAEMVSCAGGVYIPITAGGNVGATVDPTGAVSGQLCIIVNTAAVSIVITDTGTTMLSGNLTLTQYDALMLLFDGTNWLELAAPSAN